MSKTAPNMQSLFEKTVELALGEPIESVRNTTVDDRRAKREANLGRRLHFVSCFPLIGRGNVLRNRTVSHERAEALLKRATRGG